ncbi:HIT family protein [Nanoarchaeota archaeon]
MVDCEFCDVVKGKEDAEIIFEDEKCTAVLHLKPAHPGHVLLFSKGHYPIMEQVPDYVVGHMFKIANKLSTALFESLNIQGTNIIVQNGVAAGQTIPHFVIHVIPRSEGDGLNFQWEPKQPGKEEVDKAIIVIKEQTANIHPSGFQKEKREIKIDRDAVRKIESTKEENYLIKQLRKIP